MKIRILRCFTLFLLLTVSSLKAQNVPPDPSAGIQIGSTNDFGIDLATSAINIQIPGRSKTGPIPFSSSFGGTNHAYVYTIYPQSFINVNGWNLLKYSDTTGLQVTNTAHSICGGTGIAVTNFAVIDLTGAVHPFPTSFQWNTYSSCANLPSPVVTTDGSGYTLVPLTDGDPGATFALYDSSGRKYSGSVNNGECFLIGTITDPDGNSLYHHLINGGNPTIQDSLSSSPVVSLSRPGSPLQSYTTASGSTVGYTLGTTPANLKTNFGYCGQDFNYGSAILMTSLTIPDGGQYTFAYEPTPNGNGFTNDGTYFTGRIAKITFPAGGSVSYAYSGAHNVSIVSPCQLLPSQ